MAPYSDNSGSHYSQRRSSYQPQASPYQPQRPVPKPLSAHGGRSKQGPIPHPIPKPVPSRRVAAQHSVARSPMPNSLPQRVQKPGGYVVAGGSMMLALMAILLPRPTQSPTAKVNVCQQSVQAQSMLSRDELSQLLSVPERSTREAIRQVIAEPYCTMSPVEVRQGMQAEREAYPLEFDPQTWVVVLYEGNEYAGYDFSFQH